MQVAVLFPSCVATVIVAEPDAILLTKPLELTDATEVLFELQFTFLVVALAGLTVAVNCKIPPFTIETEVELNVTPVTDITGEVTVTE
jgi:hypothetical protein